MASNEIHKKDIGTIFETTLNDGTNTIDISGATSKEIIFKKPNGTSVAQAAVFKTDGTDGILQYTTIADDLDQDGEWSIQAKVTIPSGTWSSDVTTFTVYKNLWV